MIHDPKAAAGILEGKAHVLPVRVYYEDTDFSGVVYHASYMRFMERGRTEFLRALGIHQQEILDGAHGDIFHFAVAKMEVDFRRPARMDDVLSVLTRVDKVGGASIDLAQTVFRSEEILVQANVRVACVAGDKPARMPAWVKEKLED